MNLKISITPTGESFAEIPLKATELQTIITALSAHKKQNAHLLQKIDLALRMVDHAQAETLADPADIEDAIIQEGGGQE